MADPKPRRIVQEESFRNQIAEIGKNFGRWNEIISGLEWVLQWHPEYGTPVAPLSYWCLDASKYLGQRIRFYYWFDDESVHLVAARVVPESEPGSRWRR